VLFCAWTLFYDFAIENRLLRFYSLRSELLVSEMDVSRTKIRLDTSISATSNSKRREYNSTQWNLHFHDYDSKDYMVCNRTIGAPNPTISDYLDLA
jgi:hypothetical protein